MIQVEFAEISVVVLYGVIDTLNPRQNGHHFPDDIFILNENELIAIKIPMQFVSKSPNQQYCSIGSDNGSAPTRRQAIIWTNGGLGYQCLFAWLTLSELKQEDMRGSHHSLRWYSSLFNSCKYVRRINSWYHFAFTARPLPFIHTWFKVLMSHDKKHSYSVFKMHFLAVATFCIKKHLKFQNRNLCILPDLYFNNRIRFKCIQCL